MWLSWKGERDGIDAPMCAGKGAIDPFSERLRGRTWANGIGRTIVGQNSPPIILSEGEYNGFSAANQVGRAAINPFAKQSGGLARATASEVPSDYIPSPSMVRREENILCSLNELTMGRLFPSTLVSALMALMVVLSACMPLQYETAMHGHAIKGWEGGHCGDRREQSSQGTL
jgi:hypothetical protein